MIYAFSSTRAMPQLEWILLLTLLLVWGGSYFFMALAITAVQPLTILKCRLVIGSLRPIGRHAFYTPDHATRRTRLTWFFHHGTA